MELLLGEPILAVAKYILWRGRFWKVTQEKGFFKSSQSYLRQWTLYHVGSLTAPFLNSDSAVHSIDITQLVLNLLHLRVTGLGSTGPKPKGTTNGRKGLSVVPYLPTPRRGSVERANIY